MRLVGSGVGKMEEGGGDARGRKVWGMEEQSEAGKEACPRSPWHVFSVQALYHSLYRPDAGLHRHRLATLYLAAEPARAGQVCTMEEPRARRGEQGGPEPSVISWIPRGKTGDRLRVTETEDKKGTLSDGRERLRGARHVPAPHAARPRGKLETAAEVLGFRPASPRPLAQAPPEEFLLIPRSRALSLSLSRETAL